VLKFAALNLKLHFPGIVRLPRWLGSAFRGGLGEQLRKIVCYRPMLDCQKCEKSGECLFYAAYQNPFAKRGQAPPPKPVVLIPPFFGREMTFGPGGELEVGLLLLGDYVRFFPHVLLALQQLGGQGLGDARHVGLNRFEVILAVNKLGGGIVYKDGAIHLSNLKQLEVRELEPFKREHVRIGFRTPIELPLGFPPSPEHLLNLIRGRLIMFVNEYGTGEKVPEFTCRGKVKCVARHYHRLPGFSRRSGRREFWHCWTGIADYDFEELDKRGQWLLGVGRVLGAGAKSSFGLGFINIEPIDKEGQS
jgi:hypothetical protein